jgi:hypothetical protein
MPKSSNGSPACKKPRRGSLGTETEDGFETDVRRLLLLIWRAGRGRQASGGSNPTQSFVGVGPMRSDERIASMLDRARELAARGHYPMMIEAVLAANGFPEAAEWIDQPHIRGQN